MHIIRMSTRHFLAIHFAVFHRAAKAQKSVPPLLAALNVLSAHKKRVSLSCFESKKQKTSSLPLFYALI